jgi:hypothetical protein
MRRTGDRVYFAHDLTKPFTVTKVLYLREGMMLELQELPGQFAAHLFIGATGETKYRLLEGPAIQCLVCGRVSHNPHDIEHRYCGFCHHFFTLEEEDKPRPGDRVKLCGSHRYAGHDAVYVCDRPFAGGLKYPEVRVNDRGTNVRCLVLDPEHQMRKL